MVFIPIAYLSDGYPAAPSTRDTYQTVPSERFLLLKSRYASLPLPIYDGKLTETRHLNLSRSRHGGNGHKMGGNLRTGCSNFLSTETGAERVGSNL